MGKNFFFHFLIFLDICLEIVYFLYVIFVSILSLLKPEEKKWKFSKNFEI